MDTGLSTAQRSFLKDVTEREKRLRSLKNDTITHTTEISALQEDLREKYQSLITEHPSYGPAIICKDVEEKLWKLCFYVKIEEYRKSIRKTVILRDGKDDGVAVPAAPSLALKAGTHLAKLISAFTKFLFDGMSFYQDFMLKLESSSKKLEMGHSPAGATNLNVNFAQCVFRCLMYLGDLARYRELYCESKVKDFSEAERYYERASFLSFNSGHPHNQLAVLSSYSDTDYLAVYHYCRSVMILKPFASGYDNLGLIFDKNMRAYSALKDDTSDSRSQVPLRDKKQLLAARAHVFFVRFLRLHGDLFKWSRHVTDLLKEKLPLNVEEGKRETPVPDFDVTACMSLIQRVLSDFEYFMRFDESSVFSEMLLVKLLTISIFSVHNAPSIPSPGESEAGRDKEKEREKERAAMDPLDCSLSESLAMYFLFNFISRCAALFSMIPSSVSKMVESNVRRVLPVLTVFADWCCLNPRYLGYSSLGRDGKYNRRDKEREKASIVHRNGEQGQRVPRAELIRAPESLLKAEEEARSSMISCIFFLDSYVKSSTIPTTGAAHTSGRGAHARHNEQRSPLKEDIELRGFLPLKNSTNVWSADLKGLSIALPIAVPDELARNRRLKDLSAFIEKLKSAPRPVPQINRDRDTGSESHGGVPLNRSEKQKQSRRGDAEDASDVEDEKDKSAARPGLLHVSMGISNAIRQKEREKERERINERTNIKMGDLRELIAEEQEQRDQIGKKGRRESSPKPDDEKREQRAGLLIVAPGVLTAARQKERDRERYMEQSTKIRGERRPVGKLVDTRTSAPKSSAKSRDRGKDKEGLRRAAVVSTQQVGSAEKPSSAPLSHRNVNGSEKSAEEFPPLPGAREPVTLAPATLNYAASALFTPAAPDNMDPFANDDSDAETTSAVDEDEDEAGLDAFQVCDIEVVGDDEGEGDMFNECSQWNYSLGYTSVLSSTITAPPASLLQTNSAVSPSGAFSGLFSGLSSGNNINFYQYADSSQSPNMMPTTSIAQNEMPDDDDFDDDVIVFRPAFSRINATSSSMPPPLSFIGGSSLEVPQQPNAPNDLPPALNFSYGSRASNRPYETETNIGHIAPQPHQEPNWQSWDKNGSLSLYGNGNGIGVYGSIPTPAPIPIPMGSMIFNDPSPSRYSLPRELPQDSHSHSHSQQDTLGSNDNWWVGSSFSDSQTAAVNHQNPSDSEYAYTRGSRGPPALQQVPNGWDARQRVEGALPFTSPPPGLLPPPPGFSSTSTGHGSQYPYAYNLQQQQGQGQVDSRLPSNFFKSNG